MFIRSYSGGFVAPCGNVAVQWFILGIQQHHRLVLHDEKRYKPINMAQGDGVLSNAKCFGNDRHFVRPFYELIHGHSLWSFMVRHNQYLISYTTPTCCVVQCQRIYEVSKLKPTSQETTSTVSLIRVPIHGQRDEAVQVYQGVMASCDAEQFVPRGLPLEYTRWLRILLSFPFFLTLRSPSPSPSFPHPSEKFAIKKVHT